jgi:hypothetical protein
MVLVHHFPGRNLRWPQPHGLCPRFRVKPPLRGVGTRVSAPRRGRRGGGGGVARDGVGINWTSIAMAFRFVWGSGVVPPGDGTVRRSRLGGRSVTG